jgi:signal transduction histidine kinase
VTDSALAPIDKVALLRQAFAGLDDEELGQMATLTHVSTYPAGTLLCHEGEYEDVFYIIVRGEASITKKISDQEGERELRQVGAGEYVGEMALIQNAPRAANVRTLTECTVLEMSKGDFEAMLGSSPLMAMNIIRVTLNRMRANDQVAIKDLQRTNKVLAILDRNKLDFIEVAAHELRTPLTVMKGYINVMKMDTTVKANPMLVEVLEGIAKGTDRLHEVVNTMLDVTRVDSVKIVPVPVPLKSVVNDIVQRVRSEASNRTLNYVIEHDPETPFINADPTLVQKALYHIIINAIKCTPDGGEIAIRTRPVQLERGAAGAEVIVKDSGIGLDAEHHELIFEKFYQVGSVALHSSSRTAFKGGGSGLGLAIARGVARAHGGKIWVESAGHDEDTLPGSTFYFQLPISPPRPK